MKRKLTHKSVRALQPTSKPYDVHDTEISGFIARVSVRGTISYLLKYRDQAGTPKNYTIGKHGTDGLNPVTAREIAEDLRHDLKKKNIDPAKERKQQRVNAIEVKQNTLRSYYEGKYQNHLNDKKLSTQRECHRIIHSEFKELLDIPLSEIDPEWVKSWRLRRQKAGLSKETLKRYNAELDVLLTRAVEDKIIKLHPLKGKIKAIKGANRANVKPRFLSKDETDKFRAALVERDCYLKTRAESGRQWKIQRNQDAGPSRTQYRFADHLTPMCLVSLNTGVRQGELFQLEWRDIAGEFEALELRAETTKNSEPRSIPLNSEAKQALIDWRKQTKSNRLVFPNRDGEVLDNVKSAWRSLMKSWKEKFDSEPANFRWHDMRHDFASQLVMKGVPLNTVRELMGHSTLEMTLRYAHLSNNALEDAVSLLDLI